MAKAPLITNRVQALIAQVYQKHPKWKAPTVRDEVSFILRKRDPKLPLGWPSLSTVQKVLAKVRKTPGDPKDKPFCLGTLVDNPIPPEALPMVLGVWAKRLEEAKPDKDGFSFQMTFTIRDALWVARFAKLFDDPEAIWGFAFWYSVRERAYDAINEDMDMDTSDLDTELLKNFKPTPTESKRKKKGGTT